MDHRAGSDEVAHELIEVVPMVMQRLRAEVRRRREAGLSVLQIRVLAFLNRHPGAPLSAVAEHVGLTLPSMSSQITGLVGRNLVDRSVSPQDRRYVTLTLTEQGHQVLDAALRGAEAHFAQVLADLPPQERSVLVEALGLLRKLFATPAPQP